MNQEVVVYREKEKPTHKCLHQFAPISQSNQHYEIPMKEIQRR